VINQLNRLRLVDFVDPRASEGVRLSPEDMTMRVTLEGNNRRETLVLGAKLPSPPASVAARAAAAAETPGVAEVPAEDTPPEELEYYNAKMEDKAPVFTVGVPVSLLQQLRNAQDRLRERQILDVDPNTITSITLVDPGLPEVTLQRLEASNANVAAGWQLVRRSSENGPLNRPADREEVGRLIQHLCALSAEEFTADVPTESMLEDKGFSRPVRTIRLSVAAAPANAPTTPTHTVTLQLGVGTDRKVYAKLDTPPYIYRVPEEILHRTPVAPLAYRDRLVRELPAGANITTLKLVESSTGTTLLDTTLPLPPGDVVPGGAQPVPRAVVETFAAQLRSLRAQKFVQEGFTKTVMVSGEDRPWKYQLTCTLALVGGNGAQTETFTLFFSERAGGTTQFVGIPDPEYDVVFEAEQPLIDSLFALVYGSRDPGPPSSAAEPAAPVLPAAK
jgi:hypothetical protein